MLKRFENIKFGKYKFYYNISKKQNQILDTLINNSITIINSGNGEINFKLDNVIYITHYIIDNYTNLNKFNDIKQDIILLKTKNDNLNDMFLYIRNLISNLLEKYKNEVIEKIDNVHKINKEIASIISLI